MRIIRIFFAVLSVFSCLTLTGQEGKETYTDRINDFKVSYPDTWEAEQIDNAFIIYPLTGETLYAYDDDKIIDSVVEQINIMSFKTPLSIGEFLEEDYITDAFNYFVTTKEGKTKINGKEAYFYEGTIDFEDEIIVSHIYYIRMPLRIIRIYTLATKDNYDLNYKNIYSSIINSIVSYH